jgi:hypothetical protein
MVRDYGGMVYTAAWRSRLVPPTAASGGRRVRTVPIAFLAMVASHELNHPVEGS